MKKVLMVILTLVMAGILVATAVVPAAAQGDGEAQIPTKISFQGYLTKGL